MIALGDDGPGYFDVLDMRANVSKAAPQLRQELQEWTAARHRLTKKTRFCLNAGFEDCPHLQEELLELKTSWRSETLKTVEIYVNYGETWELFQCDCNDYMPEIQYIGECQLEQMYKYMEAVVELLNAGCESIELLQIRHDRAWWNTAWLRKSLNEDFDLFELDDFIPSFDGLHKRFEPQLFGENTVLEYLLRPLQGLKRCVRVDMEQQGRRESIAEERKARSEDYVGKVGLVYD